ncbi:MAG: type 4 pilus major pilin [Boseongicola sp.]|nr:type 4 pilus major pilin [Boseongicola sp.]
MTDSTPGGDGRAAPRKRRLPRRRRRGLTMWEMMLVVAVMAFVVVGVVALYNVASTSVRILRVQSVLATAEETIRRAYSSQPQYEANMTQVLWSAMPTTAIQGTGANRDIVTPWGGEIFAGGGNTPDDDGTGTASNNRFYITVLGLPEAACERLATSYLNRSDVVGLDVEGAAATAFTQVNTAAQIALFDAVSEIETECDGGDDDKIAIVFRS